MRLRLRHLLTKLLARDPFLARPSSPSSNFQEGTHMRHVLVLSLALAMCRLAVAQDHSAHQQAKPATLMSGYGDLHHPVSTSNPQAQQFFDQGLRQIYAFNHDEAARSFQRATELDPKLAIAYWGVAEAVGPNCNGPPRDARFADGT